MEARARPKMKIAATMQMDRLTTRMINIREMITIATIRITMIIKTVASWRISNMRHINRMCMIWDTSACQTIQIVDMSIMAPFLNKKKKMRTKNH